MICIQCINSSRGQGLLSLKLTCKQLESLPPLTPHPLLLNPHPWLPFSALINKHKAPAQRPPCSFKTGYFLMETYISRIISAFSCKFVGVLILQLANSL